MCKIPKDLRGLICCTGSNIEIPVHVRLVACISGFMLEVEPTWAYGKEKIRGAERNLPDFFGLCPIVKKNFPEKLSKIVVDRGGGGRRVITKNSY